MALVRTDVSEERIASIIRVKRIGAPGTMLTVTSKRSTLRCTDSYRPDDRVDTILRNIGSYKSQTE
jgi:hypothetical protein